MRTPISIFVLGLILVSCVSTEGMPNFERMNEAELAAYNRGRPIEQMIVCMEGDRSFSRVRRRSCMTVNQAYGSVQQADQLGVLNAIPGKPAAE